MHGPTMVSRGTSPDDSPQVILVVIRQEKATSSRLHDDPKGHFLSRLAETGNEEMTVPRDPRPLPYMHLHLLFHGSSPPISLSLESSRSCMG